MPKLSLSDLQELRNKARTTFSSDDSTAPVRILVGMGTCGIAAGAQEAFSAITEEIAANGLNGIVVSQTGCIGQCQTEPTVEVAVPGMPSVIYGNVDAATAKTIVRKHVMEKSLVDGHIYNHPSPDIIG